MRADASNSFQESLQTGQLEHGRPSEKIIKRFKYADLSDDDGKWRSAFPEIIPAPAFQGYEPVPGLRSGHADKSEFIDQQLVEFHTIRFHGSLPWRRPRANTLVRSPTRTGEHKPKSHVSKPSPSTGLRTNPSTQARQLWSGLDKQHRWSAQAEQRRSSAQAT